jgi:aminocarboxymuconate-semialdehyde decarboxylase
MIIDTHTHHIPKSFLDGAIANPDRYKARVTDMGGGLFEMRPEFWTSARFTSVYHLEPTYYDWGARVRHMDEQGIDVAVVSINQAINYAWAAPELAREIAAAANDDLAIGSNEFPGRIYGIAQVPLQDPVGAVVEVTRAIEDLGLKGVQLLSNVEGRNLDQVGFDPLFERIEELGVPIFLHPYGVLNDERMNDYYLANVVGFPAEQAMAAAALIFGGVLDRYPGLRILLAHGGGAFPYILGRIERGMEVLSDQMATKRNLREYLDRFYVDTLIHDDASLGYLFDTLGHDHVVLGTDWPYWMMDPDMFARLERVASQRGIDGANALGAVAARLFDLPPDALA